MASGLSWFTRVPLVLAGLLCHAQSVDWYIQREMQLNELPGVAVVLVRGNKVALIATYGYADLETQRKLTANTAFELASVSKTFTAIAILQLAREGILNLTDPVVKYLPELRDAADQRWEQVRVVDLLRHRSGLTRNHDFRIPCCGRPGDGDLQLAVQRLARVKLASVPGRRFVYANSNYVLLAALIERLSGMPFSCYMAERVFLPLGLSQTTLDENLAEQWGLAAFHERQWGKLLRVPGTFRGWPGSSRVKSTPSDLAKYLLALLSGDPYQENSWWKQLHPPYDAGWFVHEDEHELGGQRILQHGGNLWGVNTAIVLAPRSRLAAAVLINATSDRAIPIARALIAHLYGRPLPAAARTARLEDPDFWAQIFLLLAIVLSATSAYLLWDLVKARLQLEASNSSLLAWMRAMLLWAFSVYCLYSYFFSDNVPPSYTLPRTVRLALPLLVISASVLFFLVGMRAFKSSSKNVRCEIRAQGELKLEAPTVSERS